MTKSQNDQQAVKSNASTFVCLSSYPQSRQFRVPPIRCVFMMAGAVMLKVYD